MTKYVLTLLSTLLLVTVSEVKAQTEVQIWTSNGTNTIQQLVEGSVSDLISTGAITPWGIAVDQVAGKLYWSNVTEGTIKRADLDGANIETLISGLDLPRGVAFDESTNTLFWAEAGVTSPGIKSADLSETPLVIADLADSVVVSPYHIALDTLNQLVYWVDNASDVKEINRIGYDGTDFESIISGGNIRQVAGISLDAATNTLYWSDFEDDVIYSADPAIGNLSIEILSEIQGDATPWAIDVDSQSEFLYWTDYLNSTIHKIDLSTSDQTEIANGVSTASGLVTYTDPTIEPGSPENFVTIWNSDNNGLSEDDEITIPTHPGSTYNYDVYWEAVDDTLNNGTIENISGNVTIDFGTPGTYRVEIAGTFPRILFYDPNAADSVQAIDPEKILLIEQWGNIAWTSMNNAFYGATNLRLSASDAPDLSSVEDLSSMFFGASSLKTEAGGTMNNWDVSTVRIFDNMFNGAVVFNADISSWNTGSAEQMNGMFFNNTVFTGDLSNWDVSNVMSMSAMFYNNHEFNADLSGWDVANVTDMSELFFDNYLFNSDISGWNVGSVTNMNYMFRNALVFDQDLSGWDVSGVQQFEGTFANAESFNSDISGWSTGNALTMNSMFLNALSFDQDLGGWDIEDVGSMENMLTSSGLSVSNYDKTLIGWEAQTVQTDITLDADGLQYCQGEGADARQSLIDVNSWIIIDAGLADDCIPTNVDEEGDVPVVFSLDQNYPNPFNPTTLINFDLPESGRVSLVIYDMTGRTVQTLLDGNLSAGRHQVSFEAGQLSSGVYLYRLQTQGATATRKMLLVK